ncbi:unnamed protein product, partial [Mesorhabditis spiculigera]
MQRPRAASSSPPASRARMTYTVEAPETFLIQQRQRFARAMRREQEHLIPRAVIDDMAPLSPATITRLLEAQDPDATLQEIERRLEREAMELRARTGQPQPVYPPIQYPLPPALQAVVEAGALLDFPELPTSNEEYPLPPIRRRHRINVPLVIDNHTVPLVLQIELEAEERPNQLMDVDRNDQANPEGRGEENAENAENVGRNPRAIPGETVQQVQDAAIETTRDMATRLGDLLQWLAENNRHDNGNQVVNGMSALVNLNRRGSNFVDRPGETYDEARERVFAELAAMRETVAAMSERLLAASRRVPEASGDVAKHAWHSFFRCPDCSSPYGQNTQPCLVRDGNYLIFCRDCSVRRYPNAVGNERQMIYLQGDIPFYPSRKQLECAVCFIDYNLTTHRPLVLSCGHLLCTSCYTRLQSLQCPICRCEDLKYCSVVGDYVQSMLKELRQMKASQEEIQKEWEQLTTGICQYCTHETPKDELQMCTRCFGRMSCQECAQQRHAGLGHELIRCAELPPIEENPDASEVPLEDVIPHSSAATTN